MQAAWWGMNHFSTFLGGQKFILFTDHNAIANLNKIHTKTMCRINEIIATYNFTISHKKAKKCQLIITAEIQSMGFWNFTTHCVWNSKDTHCVKK
jgi:hypothetical protein